MTFETYTDESLLSELGKRLGQTRIAGNLTQAELAKEAGVSRSTVERLEAGQSTQLTKFLRILKVLKVVDPVMNAIPDVSRSPIELAKRQSGLRKRVRHKETPETQESGAWRWRDEE